MKAKSLPFFQKVMFSVFWGWRRTNYGGILAQEKDHELPIHLKPTEWRFATPPAETETRQALFQANSANGRRHATHRFVNKGVAGQIKLGDLSTSPLFAWYCFFRLSVIPSIERTLRERRFSLLEEMKEAVESWRENTKKIFYQDRLLPLLKPWKKCIANGCDFFEKFSNDNEWLRLQSVCK